MILTIPSFAHTDVLSLNHMLGSAQVQDDDQEKRREERRDESRKRARFKNGYWLAFVDEIEHLDRDYHYPLLDSS